LKLLAPSALDLGAYGALPHAFGVQKQSVQVLLFSHSNTAYELMNRGSQFAKDAKKTRILKDALG